MFEGIVPVLSLVTLLAVAVLALISKRRTRNRMRDPDAPVSSLAGDGKHGGVAFLRPLAERVADNRRGPMSRPLPIRAPQRKDDANRRVYDPRSGVHPPSQDTN